MTQLLRHIAACNTARFPGGRIAFHIGATQVGWLNPALAKALAPHPGITTTPAGLTLSPDHTTQFPTTIRTLSTQGFFRWRDEAFDIRATPTSPVLAQIDRGAVPAFGILAQGVHLNGLVHRPDGLHLWVAKRAANKTLDPGKFDNLVAGGIPTGLTPDETLAKEAAEEAAIPQTLIQTATHHASLAYTMETSEGVRRDIIHCYDLILPQTSPPRHRRRSRKLRPLAHRPSPPNRPRNQPLQVQREPGADRPVPAAGYDPGRGGGGVAASA